MKSCFGELGVDERALANLKNLDIHEPTPIQAETIPPLMRKRDVVAMAPTGSGKTLAFVLPMISALDPALREPQALILAPTRELAQQIAQVVDDVTQGIDLDCALIYGGTRYEKQRRALARGAQVVVGTPGRILDLMGQRALRLQRVRYAILDEADRMFDEGFGPDVNEILSATPRDRQSALFSATIPPWIQRVVDKHLRDPVEVRVGADGDGMVPIEHSVMIVPKFDKPRALRRLLDQRGDGTTLVFGRTKHGVERLRVSLAADGYKVRALQGNLNQRQRDEVLKWFRSDKGEILLATNIAARGLDILSIGLVVNYDIPESADMFTHRVGRTGRMGRSGKSVTLVTGADVVEIARIEQSIGAKIPRTYWSDIEAAMPSAPRSNGQDAAGEEARTNGLRILPGERLSGSRTGASASERRPRSNRRRRRTGARSGR
ncbi:MAG: DEAD/DEAH box helicase [Chloroflexi bacterium]|nr:DEAD/DEAH box helicase [Chloroflexota bacterium]MCY3938978.1 DEAD/DEAH box helicase [Chloroflexota bacterium]